MKRFEGSYNIDKQKELEASAAFNKEFKLEDEVFIEEDIKEGDEKIDMPVGKIASMVSKIDEGFSDLESADGEHEVEQTMNKKQDVKTL